VSTAEAERVLVSAGLDPSLRAENLTTEQYVTLANALV